MARYLITGGAGFLGSYLCERMLAAGHEVVCVDNFITGKRENLTTIERDPRFAIVTHDISKPYVVDPTAQRFDWVLHFASPASPVDYLEYPIPTLKVGALGTHNALGIAKAHGAKFMLASTSEVYGDPQVHPQPESYWGHVNTVGPRGVYDEAKRFAEAMTMAYHRYHGLDTRIVRIFNTYGPRMRMEDGRAVPAFISQALRHEDITIFGDGSQTRSFCYVDDLIKGIVRFMATDCHEPVNLGNPDEFTIKELAEEVVRMTGSKSQLTYHDLPQDDPKQRRPIITRAQELLQWTPTIRLQDGLQRTIAWFQECFVQ